MVLRGICTGLTGHACTHIVQETGAQNKGTHQLHKAASHRGKLFKIRTGCMHACACKASETKFHCFCCQSSRQCHLLLLLLHRATRGTTSHLRSRDPTCRDKQTSRTESPRVTRQIVAKVNFSSTSGVNGIFMYADEQETDSLLAPMPSSDQTDPF